MVSMARGEPDWSTFPDSDGEPVAENSTNLAQMTDLIYAVGHYLAPRGRFAVGGNQFIYYDRRDGRRHVSPDVFIALGVAPGRREKWETWREGGKFPDIVFEITSPSTQEEDLGAKVELYGQLGAREYYIYDPAWGLESPLRAYRRRGRVLEEQEVRPGPAVWSPLLETELRVVDRWLRLMDPATGEPVPVAEEDHAGRLAAEEHAARAEEQAARAGERVEREQAARQAAEERAAREQERALQARRELEAVRAELARLRAERENQ